MADGVGQSGAMTEAADQPVAPAGEGDRGGVRSVVLVAAVVALVAVLGGLVWWRAHRPSGPHHVVVIGDSVTYASSPAIYERFEGAADVAITSRPFYRTIDLVEPFQEAIAARREAGQGLDRAIVLAGYNDVIRDDRDASGLPKLLDEAGRFDCAVWLTLPARPGGNGAGRPDFPPAEATAWNERVRTEAASRPHVHVSDEWQRTVEADGGERLLQDDGVHPVRAGHLALAAAMDRALAAECGS